MNKGLKGFLIGILAVALIFVCTVLILASVHGVNFVEEIQSWFASKPPIEETVTAIRLLKI